MIKSMSVSQEICLIFDLLKLCPLAWEGHSLVGELLLDDRSRSLLNSLVEADGSEVELRVQGDVVSLFEVRNGLKVKIRVDPPRGSTYCMAKDEDDLLSISSLRTLPENFALTESRFLSWEPPSVAAKMPAVLITANFIKGLEASEVLDFSNNRYAVTTHDSKIQIPIIASAATLARSVERITAALDKLNALFLDSLHASEKKRILRSALISTLKSCDETQRLTHFLLHCDELLENAQNNYDLFVSSFSFQNDLDKLNEQKREFSVKLNGLLIGIQGKLLAIPVSTILATTQLKDASDPDYFLVNLSVMASSFIFLVIIVWLIRSQMIAIQAIESEISHKASRFRLELPKLYPQVEKTFCSLDQDCRLNLKMAKVLIGISYILTFITWHVFLNKTEVVFSYIVPLVDWVRDIVIKACA
jgi:hypothetical protein